MDTGAPRQWGLSNPLSTPTHVQYGRTSRNHSAGKTPLSRCLCVHLYLGSRGGTRPAKCLPSTFLLEQTHSPTRIPPHPSLRVPQTPILPLSATAFRSSSQTPQRPRALRV